MGILKICSPISTLVWAVRCIKFSFRLNVHRFSVPPSIFYTDAPVPACWQAFQLMVRTAPSQIAYPQVTIGITRVPRVFQSIISSLTCLIILAGLPTTILLAGIFSPALINVSAPTIHSSPNIYIIHYYSIHTHQAVASNTGAMNDSAMANMGAFV